LPVGGKIKQEYEAKIIYATNKDLSSEISNGSFRKDLYFRMVGATLHLPALRERPEDIEMLAAYFVYRFIKENQSVCDKQYQGKIFSLPPGEIQKLKGYSYPGNIRELEKIMHQACINAMLKHTHQLSIELPDATDLPAKAGKQEPVLFSFEQLFELLQHKIINSKGLPNQIRTDLIDYLHTKGKTTTEIAQLLGITKQSFRNLKSQGNRD
jgi:transcriptional regulator with GAF, ATPase, and Fis domain